MFIILSLLHSHIHFCSHLSLSFPIPQVAGVKKAMNVFSKKKKEKEKDKKGKEEEEEEGEKGGDSESRRKWLKVMMTNADGWRYSLSHIHVVTCEYVCLVIRLALRCGRWKGFTASTIWQRAP